ncbi:CST complex subunit STN1 [Taenia crassiceps]|uniref:CST complex subunit STN1 n=1 Tax=Taenia crassiceps TaxID=6207 RepID=A0ABR4QRX4_9CEST
MDELKDDSQWINGTVLEIPSERCPVILDPLTKLNFRILIGDILKLSPSPISNGLFRFGSRWVSYVDICGVIRQIDVRQNYYLAQVDDGTGLLSCTIWRRHVSPRLSDLLSQKHSAESIALGQKLLQLAIRSIPAVHPVGKVTSNLSVGDAIHLRGRLQFFREAINISANYCRVIANPQELLDSILQAHQLKSRVYGRPYSAVEVLDHLKAGLQNMDGGLLRRIQTVIENDGLFLFTALDLQLNAEVKHQIDMEGAVMEDELCCGPDWENILERKDMNTKKSLESIELKRRVQEIIEQLLKEGTIFRCADPIGGMHAYHYTLRNRSLAKQVFQIISMGQKDHERGVPFNVVLEKLRSFCSSENPERLYRWITRQALEKVISALLERSRIYIVNPGCYKLA